MSDYLFATTFISMDYAFTVGAYHSTIGDDSLLFAYDIVSAVFNLVIVHSFVLLLIGCVTQWVKVQSVVKSKKVKIIIIIIIIIIRVMYS